MVRKPNQDRKEKLISSALKLFVSNGVANTSTAAIASDAGCAAGTLFLYFPTKQALIDELALKIGKKQSEYIKSLLNPDFSVMEMFSTIWHGSVHWFMENLEAFQYIQQVRNAGLISVETVQESNQFFDYYYVAIQKGFEQDWIKPYPIEMIGGILYQDIVNVLNLILNQLDTTKHNQYIHSGFEIFWNGIKTREV